MTSIMSSLERDFEKASKRSVQQCLRSKKIPYAEVEAVMKQQSISMQDLKTAFSSVLVDYLAPLRQQPPGASTLQAASKLGAVVRFIQLVLESLNRISNHEQRDESAEENYLKLVSQATQGLTGVCGSLVEHNKVASTVDVDEVYHDDATENCDALGVIYYCIGALLCLHHYVPTRPVLLLTIWETITELLELAGTAVDPSTRRLPSHLANDVVHVLVPFLRDGLAAMHHHLDDAARNGKLLAFLLSRLKLVLKDASVRDEALSIVAAVVGSDGILRAAPAGRWKAFAAAIQNAQVILAELNVDAKTLLSLRVTLSSDHCFYWAQAQILLQGMETASLCREPMSLKNVESMLKSCRHLLFTALPRIDPSVLVVAHGGRDLVAKACRLVAVTLWRCERMAPSVASNASPGRAQYHRVVVSWLMVSDPFSSELVLTSLALYIRLSSDDASILPLLSGLLVDRRTHVRLREHICVLLDRLGSVEDAVVVQRVRAAIAPATKQACAGLGKKRPRSLLKQSALPKESLLRIFSAINVPNQAFAAQSIHHLVRDDGSLRRRYLRVATLELRAQSFVDMDTLVNVGWAIARVWRANNSSSPSDSKSLMQLVEAVLITSQRAMESPPKNYRTLTCVVGMVLHVFDVILEAPFTSLECLSLYFACLRCAEKTAALFQATSEPAAIARCTALFQRLLSFDLWIVRSSALSSLVSFASGLPSTHKGVLRSCVPSTMIENVQRLIEKTVQMKTVVASDSSPSRREAVSECLPPRHADSNSALLPQKSSVVIPAGSFVTKMPTQSGREAIVIFPPGSQSLADIQLMARGEQMLVQAVQSATVSSKGEFKLQLRQV